VKNFPWMFWALLAFILAMAALTAWKKGSRRRTPHKVRKKPVLSQREQGMYFRLSSTFPQHVVLSQVSFSALITSARWETRNQFNRKFADFVLCTKSFQVLAVIELDDSSHKGREVEDEDRDSWLTTAGYRVVRYANIPDTAELLADFPPPA
jgi:very-short-patch-repair endonuclease